jgi:hypothetical protein
MSDAEVPDADAQEQSQPVDPPERPEPPDRDVEVPEADAIEQSMPVPADDDHDR